MADDAALRRNTLRNIEDAFRPTHDEIARQGLASALRKHAIVDMKAALQADYEDRVQPSLAAVGEAPEGLASTGDANFAQLWTQAGMPAVTIPSGTGPRGLPLGIQIVGRYREDQAALQAAAWTEGALAFKPGLAGG